MPNKYAGALRHLRGAKPNGWFETPRSLKSAPRTTTMWPTPRSSAWSVPWRRATSSQARPGHQMGHVAPLGGGSSTSLTPWARRGRARRHCARPRRRGRGRSWWTGRHHRADSIARLVNFLDGSIRWWRHAFSLGIYAIGCDRPRLAQAAKSSALPTTPARLTDAAHPVRSDGPQRTGAECANHPAFRPCRWDASRPQDSPSGCAPRGTGRGDRRRSTADAG